MNHVIVRIMQLGGRPKGPHGDDLMTAVLFYLVATDYHMSDCYVCVIAFHLLVYNCESKRLQTACSCITVHHCQS